MMTKTYSTIIVLLLAGAATGRVPAQAPSGQAPIGPVPIGPVHMTFDSGSYVGRSAHFANVVMTSKDYDLQAATVVADTPPAGAGAKAAPFSKIIARGNPAKNTQVIGRFAAEAGRTYLVHADQAVYVSEAGRKGGGRIDFTGHVVVTVKVPKELQGPGLTYVERFTVLFGPRPDYPQVNFGPGHTDFTPLP